MKPLVIVTCYNRLDKTRVMLASLEATVNLKYIDLVIVDNGSQDGTPTFLQQWRAGRKGIQLELLSENLGTSRALNLAMQQYRHTRQGVIKLDNDVKLLSPGWLHGVQRFLDHCEQEGRKVAMVSGHYPEIFTNKRVFDKEFWEWKRIIHYYPSTGCAIWYNAGFVDKTGYFDVLSADHVYGFEDLIMSAKAIWLQWEICAWEGWSVEHMHGSNSLGANRGSVVERMRPLYQERVQAMKSGGSLYTGPNGQPQLKK